MSKQLKNFESLLESEYEWPSNYLFKFIAPTTEVNDLRKLLGHGEISERPSKNGNYVSISVLKEMGSSQEVLDVYAKVRAIRGIISL